ncbi:MAG: hypothetical protein F6J87_10015 [Spirulina sp. SIO3F2]|nr:hypothetical protein [Spirulina sp. SIO3F2]
MERGLLWLPLLLGFIGLTWAGWHEYQKVQVYQTWSQGFERTKYDIYAVMGLKDNEITWGYPTRQGPINLQQFSLATVESILLEVNQTVVTDWERPPRKGKAILKFVRSEQGAVEIPFTEIKLAIAWGKFLQTQLSELKE